jgi:pimeloyl-ACP methyl ester carboxylesterase
MLLHGWSGNREVWTRVAPALCRDNAQAVVIAPDLHGFGETPFAGIPSPAQVELRSIGRTAEALRSLLGLAELPVAMVGHSMAGASLLTLTDEDIGPQVTRVLINPILVSHDRRLQRKLRAVSYLVASVGRIGPLRRAIARSVARTDLNLTVLEPELRAMFVEESLRMPGAVYARVLSAFRNSPPKIGRQRRLAIIACLDDDWVDEACLDAAAADLGLEPAQIHRIPSGGHNPHLELVDHPEWTARNIEGIVRVIDSMLITAREHTMVSTEPRARGTSDEGTETAQTSDLTRL